MGNNQIGGEQIQGEGVAQISSARLASVYDRMMEKRHLDIQSSVQNLLLGIDPRIIALYVRKIEDKLSGKEKVDVTYECFKEAFLQTHQHYQLMNLEDIAGPDEPRVYEESRGHVFVLMTDLRRLACDTWAIPTGPSLCPSRHWLKPGDDWDAADEALASFRKFVPNSQADVARNLQLRICKVEPYPETHPQVFCINTHGNRQGVRSKLHTSESGVQLADLSWVHTCVTTYLDSALEHLQGKTPRNGRRKFLLAMPLFATGGAGARNFTGQLVREILPVLLGFASSHSVDIALCTNERPVYMVMQQERARWADITWSCLTPSLRAHGDRLAQHAKNGDLVLFLGAGVSMAAGLPSWGTLLKALASDCGMSETDVNALSKLDYLDQARLIAKRIGLEELSSQIATKCKSPVFSLAHALLAVLPCSESITTNYDILFEQASASVVGRQNIVSLPYETNKDAKRWTLKMHGDVRHPEDIVLTREDYIRYESRRQALSGICQALLITKHMLFIGFSLQDANFHKIMDSVRQAMAEDSKYGTALFLLNESFMEELWDDLLDVVPMRSLDGPPQGSDWSQTARELEIFLDYLAAHSSSTAEFLLDRKFGACLSAQEITVRDYIDDFLKSAPTAVSSSPIWATVKDLLHQHFGFNHF